MREDLALKDNPSSPGSHAMYLYREVTVEKQQSAIFEYDRIKIFTQEGTKNGDVEIPFDQSRESIEDIRGRTIRADGSIAEFDGQTFEKTIVKAGGLKYYAKTFLLPDVQPGCIIEYKYRHQYKSLPGAVWPLQGSLYTRAARFLLLPARKSNKILAYRLYGPSERMTPHREQDGSFTLDVHNLPGIEQEDFMPPIKSLQARVEFYEQDPSLPSNEAPDWFWDRMEHEIGDFLEMWLNKKKALEKDLLQTISPNDSPETKLRKIYAHVQQIRKPSSDEPKTSQEEKREKVKSNSNVEDVLKRGTEYGREVNFLFIGLARAAGFDASELFLAPRNEDFFRPKLEDVSQLSADVVWVRAGDKEYLLDPGTRYFPFGLLPWYETDADGIRISSPGFHPADSLAIISGRGSGEFVTTPKPSPADARTVRHAELTLDDDGQASGKLEVDFTGQRAALRREEYRNEDDTGRRKGLGDEIKGWLPTGATFEVTDITNWDDIGEPLHIEGTVKVAGFGTPAGRRMLVPLSLSQAAEVKSFQSATRVQDIYFNYPYEEIDDVKLHAPAGFTIESLPPAQNIDLGGVAYHIEATQQNRLVEVKRRLDIKGVRLPVKAYPALRSFFNSVKSNDDAQIVLEKAVKSK